MRIPIKNHAINRVNKNSILLEPHNKAWNSIKIDDWEFVEVTLGRIVVREPNGSVEVSDRFWKAYLIG